MWHYPTSQTLGAVLLESGRASETEISWEDLRRNPDNGWRLTGLVQALRAQNKKEAAALAEARLQKAWARADVKPNASRFGRLVSGASTDNR